MLVEEKTTSIPNKNSGRKRKSLLPAPKSSLTASTITTSSQQSLTSLNAIKNSKTVTNINSDLSTKTINTLLKIGQRVCISGEKSGILRFSGETHFANGVWCGVELDEAIGLNNGSIKGIEYFKCRPKYGIFAPIDKVFVENKLPLINNNENMKSNEEDNGCNAKRPRSITSTPINIINNNNNNINVENNNGNNATFTIVSEAEILGLPQPDSDEEETKDKVLNKSTTSDVIQMSHSSNLSCINSDFSGQQLLTPDISFNSSINIDEVINSDNQVISLPKSDKSEKENCSISPIANTKINETTTVNKLKEKPLKTIKKPSSSIIPNTKTSTRSRDEANRKISLPKQQTSQLSITKTATRRKSANLSSTKTPAEITTPPFKPKTTNSATFKKPAIPTAKNKTIMQKEIPKQQRRSSTNIKPIPSIGLNTSNISETSSNASSNLLIGVAQKTSTPLRRQSIANSRKKDQDDKTKKTFCKNNLNNSSTSIDSINSRGSATSRSSFRSSRRSIINNINQSPNNTGVNAKDLKSRRASMPVKVALVPQSKQPLNARKNKEDLNKIVAKLKLENEENVKKLEDKENCLKYALKNLEYSNMAFDSFSSLLKHSQYQLQISLNENIKLDNNFKHLMSVKEDLETDIIQLRNDYEVERQDDINKHEIQINQLNEQLDDWQKMYKNVVEKNEKYVENLIAEYTSQLDSERENHVKKLNDVEEENKLIIVALETEHEKMLSDLHLAHDSKLEEMAKCFESIKINLSTDESNSVMEKVDFLRKECEELRCREKIYLEHSEETAHHKVQIAISKYKHLPEEITSLKSVLEMKNEEVASQRQKILNFETKFSEMAVLKNRLEDLKRDVENKQAIIEMKGEHEKVYMEKYQSLLRKFEKENKQNKRLSMNNEELEYKLKCFNNDVSSPGAPPCLKRSDTYELLHGGEAD